MSDPDISQIIAHQRDEPDAVLAFPDSDGARKGGVNFRN
jgi:hypothetical protein